MGRFDPYLLTDWHRDQGAALVDPNRSMPIGKHRQVSSVEATLVHVDNNATVVYGEEVKLYSIQGCPLELPEEVASLLGIRRLTGWLFYKDGEDYRNYRNHDLVVTEVPARNLYFQGKLQPSRHRKKSEIVEAFREALKKNDLTDPIQAISKGLSSLNFQPFESRTNVVSAWLIEPKVIEELSITQRTRGAEIRPDETTDSSLRGNFKPEKAEWSLGICKDIDRCIELLKIDEEKDRLFEQTENGNLFEHYRSSKPPARGPVYRLMKTIAAGLHEDVYRAAIMAALSGIDEDLYPNSSKDGPKPVMKQVKLLYHRIMYALVKRCDLSGPVLELAEIPSSGAVPSTAAHKTRREKLEEMGEKLRSLGRDVVMAGLEKTASGGDDTDKADETLAHLILATPKEWSLTAKLVSWLRSHQTQFSKTIQMMINERLRAQ